VYHASRGTLDAGQENNAASAIKIMRLQAGKNRYYEILYKPDKPGDVPQEIYARLFFPEEDKVTTIRHLPEERK
jgi:hypothetical protein